MLLANDVALAFLDVQMPDMDGFELAELMRGSDRTRHVPIIFVTAGVRDQYRLFKGYDTGAVDFLYKPIDPHISRARRTFFFQLYRQKNTARPPAPGAHRDVASERAVYRRAGPRSAQSTERHPEFGQPAGADSKEEVVKQSAIRMVNSGRRMSV